MPELAEVLYFSHQWARGKGARIRHVSLHPRARVFRRSQPDQLAKLLTGALFLDAETHGKQILFRFSGRTWLAVHLGMTGELLAREPGPPPHPHEHLVLHQKDRDLVFRDPRMFGEIRAGQSRGLPAWWKELPPQPTHRAFTRDWMREHFARHARAPVKAVLLRQECFPGIGNWMADEILWRARIHPSRRAGSLQPRETSTLHRMTVEVCRDALRVIGRNWGTPPDSWLFNHRWKDGGRCPRTGASLVRETLAGRTTCWSPARQPLHPVSPP